MASVPTGGITIPELTSASSVNSSDEVVISQSGSTKRATVDQVTSDIQNEISQINEDIAQNTDDISTNSSNISKNSDDISSLNSALADKQNNLVTDTVTISDLTITANSNSGGTGSVSVSKSGYTPVGVVGYNLANTSSGANASRCNVSRLYISGTTLTYALLNTYTSAANINFTIYVLYSAN